MIKITVRRRQLIRAAAIADAVDTDTEVHVTLHKGRVRLEAQSPGRRVDIFLTGQTSGSPGKASETFCCPSGHLSAASKAMPADDVTLSSDGVMTSGSFSLRLHRVKAGPIDRDPGPALDVTTFGAGLEDAIESVAWALPPASASQLNLHGIELACVERGALRATATDGSRIAERVIIGCAGAEFFRDPIVIPTQALKILRPVLACGTVDLWRAEGWLSAASEIVGHIVRVEVKLASLPIPPCSQAFPERRAPVVAEVDVGEMLAGLAFLVATEGPALAELRRDYTGGGRGTLTVTGGDGGASFSAGFAGGAAPSIRVGVNARHLRDALRAVRTNRALMVTGSPSEPVIVSSIPVTDDGPIVASEDDDPEDMDQAGAFRALLSPVVLP